MYDIIIIGAGPAGISAAIYGKSRGKRILMLEKNQVGGLIGTVSTVTHYTAIMKEESGKTFAERMKEQALSAGVEIRYENVTETKLIGNIKKIVTDKESYECKTVILANGGSGRMLEIPGERLKGIRLNATKDGLDYKGKKIYIIGGADGAVKEAVYLAGIAGKVTIVCVEKMNLYAYKNLKIKLLHTIILKLCRIQVSQPYMVTKELRSLNLRTTKQGKNRS